MFGRCPNAASVSPGWRRWRRLLFGGLLAIGGFSAADPVAAEDTPPSEPLAALADDDALFVLGNTLFVLYHEIGHALIDELDLPVLGREEDAADGFAAMMMIAEQPDPLRDRLMIAAADGWALVARASIDGEVPLWGEHALNRQRFFGAICMLVGSDPPGFSDYAMAAGMPAERIETCPDDYRRMKAAWVRLLAPHRVANSQPDALQVTFEPPAAEDAGLDQLAQSHAIIEHAVAALRPLVDLPRDLQISFRSCPNAAAYWHREAARIVVCYQLLAEFENLLLAGRRL